MGPLFRTIGRGTGALTRTVLPQANAYAMIRRRAAAAGIATKLGNHSFRATGITAYLKNGGTLEKAAAMANHASSTGRRQPRLADRDELSSSAPITSARPAVGANRWHHAPAAASCSDRQSETCSGTSRLAHQAASPALAEP